MTRKIFVVLFLSLFCAFCCFGQSADFVSEMLEIESTTWGQAGYFCAISLELTSENESEQVSMDALVEAGILKEPKDISAPITYAELSGLCMKAWDVPGGLMYTITKADHYAFRELQAMGYISDIADPGQEVTGLQTLNLVNRFIDAQMGE